VHGWWPRLGGAGERLPPGSWHATGTLLPCLVPPLVVARARRRVVRRRVAALEAAAEAQPAAPEAGRPVPVVLGGHRHVGAAAPAAAVAREGRRAARLEGLREAGRRAVGHPAGARARLGRQAQHGGTIVAALLGGGASSPIAHRAPGARDGAATTTAGERATRPPRRLGGGESLAEARRTSALRKRSGVRGDRPGGVLRPSATSGRIHR
jgi:hypothetical protein